MKPLNIPKENKNPDHRDRVIGYCRVSLSPHDFLFNQRSWSLYLEKRERLKSYCAYHNLKLINIKVDFITERYQSLLEVDEATLSGLSYVLGLADKGEVDGVVTCQRDQLAFDPWELLTLYNSMLSRVDLHLVDGLSSSTCKSLASPVHPSHFRKILESESQLMWDYPEFDYWDLDYYPDFFYEDLIWRSRSC